jgi:uncharacterized protein
MQSLWIKIVLLSVILTPINGNAQALKEDLMIIEKLSFSTSTRGYKVQFLNTEKNAFKKYNPVNLVFGGLLFFYQTSVSKQIAAQCPFEISCSNFSKKAIVHHGFIKGIALSADRLMRCNRIALTDIKYDRWQLNKRIVDSPINY